MRRWDHSVASADYKAIETTYGAGNLQQLRWPPSQIADTPAGALAQLYMLPGAHYTNPEFSWRYALAPSALGFVQGSGLGPQFEGDMLVGEGRTTLAGGFLFRLKLTEDRLHFSFSDSRLSDQVADNTDKFDITESESLLIGKDFGITTDIQTGPNGNVFVVSNTNGAVYEISGAQPLLFTANLNGAQETPPNTSTATGTATVLLSSDEQTARVSLNFSGLSSAQTDAHIHGPAAAGVAGPILFHVPDGNFTDFEITPSPTDVQNLKNGLLYINVHSSNFPSGEIRGQFTQSASASSVQFSSAELSGRRRLRPRDDHLDQDWQHDDGSQRRLCNQRHGGREHIATRLTAALHLVATTPRRLARCTLPPVKLSRPSTFHSLTMSTPKATKRSR